MGELFVFGEEKKTVVIFKKKRIARNKTKN